ncbi:carboxypeptidase-like regulatory domain-containing protein [Telmatobacter bradus]|uniref:carboxypeptidase-like regulatory domain-containing protein n=1 Tax=Telmatobacter bradus TaxID=474953 RepID=UPI003B43C816
MGHITDSTGAVVANATITITNLKTGVVKNITTSDSGDYTVPQLDPGTYSVQIAANGFKPEVSLGLIVEVDHALRQDFKLSVGSALSETVTVSAEGQMLHTDDATIGQVVSGELMEILPIEGRDFTNMLQIGVGTTTTPGGVQQAGFNLQGMNNTYQEVSINGAHADSISYNIDGIYDTDYVFSAAMAKPSEMAIAEFKTMNGSYGAQYGAGSAQVNVAVKSGTNQIHGGGYEFNENAALQRGNPSIAAYNRVQGTNNAVNAPYNQNQFGGVLGGPVTIPKLYNGKDKSFWFVGYDGGRRNKTQAPSTMLVPSQAELGGDFSAWAYPIYDPSTTGTQTVTATNTTGRSVFAGNKIPASRLDKTAQKIAAFYATPNISTCTDTISLTVSACTNYAAGTVTTKRSDNGIARFDHNFGVADHIFVTGVLGNDTETSPNIHYGQGNQTYQRTRLAGATWAHPFSEKLLNQATIGYSREHFLTGPTTAYGPNLSAEVGLANTIADPITYDLPSISLYDYGGIGGGSPTAFFDDLYQGVDTVTWIHGKHTMNFGMDFRRVFVKEQDNYGGTGSLTFTGEYTASLIGESGTTLNSAKDALAPYKGNAVADFLLGDTQSASGPPPLGTDLYRLWGNNEHLFFQDDYRPSDRLTVNLGLRWERPTSLHSQNGSGYSFNPNNGGSFSWVKQSFVTPILAAGGNSAWLGCCADSKLVHLDQKDFAPRLGFEYRPLGFNDKLVIRGGAGIYYDTYNRYYDGSQYDDNRLYTEAAATYTTTTGDEKVSPQAISTLWGAPITALQAFTEPVTQYALNNQVNWYGNKNPSNQQLSIGAEYSFTSTLLFEGAYVRTHGIHEATQIYIGAARQPTVAGDVCNNYQTAATAPASCATDTNFQPIRSRVPYANMPSNLYANGNFFNSNYEGLQFQLIQRPWHGAQYHLNYTYSQSMDVTSGINNIYGEQGIIQDANNAKAQYGFSGADQTHRLVATGSYELPAGHGKAIDVQGFNWLVGGWTGGGVYTLASGFPFAINGGVGNDQTGASSSRYLANYSGTSTSGFKRTPNSWADPAKYSTPSLGTYGNTNKSPERGPYFTNLDLSLSKSTKIAKTQNLRIRMEIFNATSTWHSSTYQIIPSSATAGGTTLGTLGNYDPTVGVASMLGSLPTYRTIQMGLQYTF